MSPVALQTLKTYDVALRWGAPGMAREILRERLQVIEKCSHCFCIVHPTEKWCCKCGVDR